MLGYIMAGFLLGLIIGFLTGVHCTNAMYKKEKRLKSND